MENCDWLNTFYQLHGSKISSHRTLTILNRENEDEKHLHVQWQNIADPARKVVLPCHESGIPSIFSKVITRHKRDYR